MKHSVLLLLLPAVLWTGCLEDKPLYYLLRTDGQLNRAAYWVIEKGVIRVEEPKLHLVLDRKELKQVPEGLASNAVPPSVE